MDQATGTEADTALATHEFDLLILDLGLPRPAWPGVLRKLRGRGSSMPVLILTAADSVEQRVQGLDLGADDYMAKPFSLQELEACVRALTRRGLGTAGSVIKHGPLTFDATGRVAYINEQMVELSAREMSLLEVVLQRAGRLVSKEQLVEQLCEWGRRGQQQRHRGLHPPPAQEDRAGPHPHRHRARPGLLPEKIAALEAVGRVPPPPSARVGPAEPQRCGPDARSIPIPAGLAVSARSSTGCWPAAADLADQRRADLAGGAGHCQPAP